MYCYVNRGLVHYSYDFCWCWKHGYQWYAALFYCGAECLTPTACWSLLYLSTHPQWRERAVEELKTVILKHSTTSLPGQPFHKLLSAIPLHAWEDEMPTLDLIIRETIRLSSAPTVLRRNIGKDIVIQDATIKKGDFLAYSVGETHLNPDIYTEPEEFDPSRFEKGREEDSKVPYGFMGWGAGRSLWMPEYDTSLTHSHKRSSSVRWSKVRQARDQVHSSIAVGCL